MKRTPLKRTSTLKTKTPLQTGSSLQAAYAAKIRSGEKQRYQYRPKPTNRVHFYSIFTSDLKHCIITGSSHVHIHHIFGGANKALSERYGFLLPLRPDWHVNTSYSIHQDRALELFYKTRCQQYYLKHYGSKEKWLQEFGKWWEI